MNFDSARGLWWAGWLPAGFFIFSAIMLGSLWWQYALTAKQARNLETKITAEQVGLRSNPGSLPGRPLSNMSPRSGKASFSRSLMNTGRPPQS